MSEATHVSQAINMTQLSTTVDLLKKEVSIPGIRTFHLIMRENKQSRYFVIKDMKQSTRENRIIVPMDHSQEFLEKLILVVKFVEEYLSMDPSKRAHRDSHLVFTENMYTDVGRKYYFDVYNNNGELSVKLTYNYDGRRDRIVVDSGCLIGFIGIIENFEKEYPSITGKDDYHRYTNRRFDNRRHVHFGGPGSTSQAISPTTIQPQGVAIASNVNLKSNVKKSTERKSTHALKVCSDPAPCSFEQNGKKYHFEVVKGDKTFLRVTELIEDKRKTAIHIPIESVKLFLDSLNDMNDKYSKVRLTEDKAPASSTQ